MLFYNDDGNSVGYLASSIEPYHIQDKGIGLLTTSEASGFSGFSKETLEFLDQVHRNNSKPWFEEHRDTYERFLLHPLRSLAADLSSIISRIDPEIETNPLRVVSRIHRPIATSVFSHDKSLYKGSMWLTFRRRIEEWQDSPAFYFEISPDSYRYGMGYYAVSRETMDALRRLIEKKPALLRKHLAAIKGIPGMTIEGQAYKRPLNPAIVPDRGVGNNYPWH
jgi:uncharacterized protein (TIGR02453 family)